MLLICIGTGTGNGIVGNCRQAAAGDKGHRYDSERKGARESRAFPAPDANAELASSMQVSFFSYHDTIPKGASYAQLSDPHAHF